MPDLADRISRGAVAALDLAPFDDRFAKLSRQVLAGGASRFGRVVADDQPVHYVIPVGLPHERIDYGALVLQSSRAGVLWRDAAGIDRHALVDLDSADAHFSALTLGGEQWVRFDLGPDFAFLVPPVSSPHLRSTLIQMLNARPGTASAGVTAEPEPEPAPVVVPDPPEPEPELPPEAPEPEKTVAAPAVDPDATQAMAAAPDGDEEWAPHSDSATPASAAAPPPGPTRGEERATEHTRGEDTPAEEVDIFRAEARHPGSSPLPSATPAPVAASQTAREVVQPAPAAAVAAPGGGMSLTLRGFLIGLVAALLGGGLALAVRLLGA